MKYTDGILFIVITLLLFALFPAFSQTSVGKIEMQYTADSRGITINIFDITLKDLQNNEIFYSFMLRQNNEWIDLSWHQQQPILIPHYNAHLKGLVCSFTYSFSQLNRISNLNLPYKGYFFIMNQKTNDIIASSTIEFRINIAELSKRLERQDLPPEEMLIGEYALEIVNNPYSGYWDRIIIQQVTDTRVSGEVWIDWDIGIQARAPEDWEKIYRLSFSANRERERFIFSVIVGADSPRMLEYNFTLNFEPNVSSSSHHLQGQVLINPLNNPDNAKSYDVQGSMFRY